jgi:hypothetical protein
MLRLVIRQTHKTLYTMKQTDFFTHLCLSAVAVLTLMASCSLHDDDDPYVNPPDPPTYSVYIDSVRQACWSPLYKMTEANFRKNVENKGWRCSATYEISPEGNVASENLWGNIIGLSATDFVFEKDSVILLFYSDALPPSESRTYRKCAYTYNEADNGVYINGKRELQFIGPDAFYTNEMFAIEYIAHHGDGTPVYGVSYFKRMSADDLVKALKEHHVKTGR